MKIFKTFAATLALLTLSSCATIFGDNNTFHKAPVFCSLDFLMSWSFIVPWVNQLNGSCQIEKGFLNNALKTDISI